MKYLLKLDKKKLDKKIQKKQIISIILPPQFIKSVKKIHKVKFIVLKNGELVRLTFIGLTFIEKLMCYCHTQLPYLRVDK